MMNFVQCNHFQKLPRILILCIKYSAMNSKLPTPKIWIREKLFFTWSGASLYGCKILVISILSILWPWFSLFWLWPVWAYKRQSTLFQIKDYNPEVNKFWYFGILQVQSLDSGIKEMKSTFKKISAVIFWKQ